MVRINSRNHVIENNRRHGQLVKAPQGLSTSESTYRKTTTPIYKNTDPKSYTFYRYAVLDAII